MNPFDEFFMPFIDWGNFPFRLNGRLIMKLPSMSSILIHNGQERTYNGNIHILTYGTEFKSITFPLSDEDSEHSTKWNLRFTLERRNNSVDLS